MNVPFGICNGVYLKGIHTGSRVIWLILLHSFFKNAAIGCSIPKDIP